MLWGENTEMTLPSMFTQLQTVHLQAVTVKLNSAVDALRILHDKQKATKGFLVIVDNDLVYGKRLPGALCHVERQPYGKYRPKGY